MIQNLWFSEFAEYLIMDLSKFSHLRKLWLILQQLMYVLIVLIKGHFRFEKLKENLLNADLLFRTFSENFVICELAILGDFYMDTVCGH